MMNKNARTGHFHKVPAQKVAQTQDFRNEKTLDEFFTTTESDKKDNLRSPAMHGASSVAKENSRPKNRQDLRGS